MPSIGLCLGIQVIRGADQGPAVINLLLLETGDYFLLESGDNLIL